MDRAALKAKAKMDIRGKIWNLLGVSLIIYIVIFAISFILGFIPGVGSLLAVIVSAPLTLSLIKIYLAIANEDKTPQIADAFCGYDDWKSAMKLYLLMLVYVFLWSLLLLIPGIIKSYAYSQAYFILAENKGMSAREALRRSEQMMNGRKMDFFILSLSFIGWSLLGALTFGIAYIWILPYMQATYANFYNSIKPANDAPVIDAAPSDTTEK